MKPLRGGIKLEGKKEATIFPWTIARPALPRRVRIPLNDSQGFAQAIVGAGERVRAEKKLPGLRTTGQSPSMLPFPEKSLKLAPRPLKFFLTQKMSPSLSSGKSARVGNHSIPKPLQKFCKTRA